MIDTFTIPLEKFMTFLEGYCRFHRRWADEDEDAAGSVSLLAHFGATPEPFSDESDLIGELLEGRLLFFPVHEPLVGDKALCIDGSRRRVEDFGIGPADSYGFLAELNDGEVSLHPALYDASGETPSLDLQGHCGVLDTVMERFAQRFGC